MLSMYIFQEKHTDKTIEIHLKNSILYILYLSIGKFISIIYTLCWYNKKKTKKLYIAYITLNMNSI